MFDLSPDMMQYILEHSDPEPEVLRELTRATHLSVLRPRMLSGPLQGGILRMFCRMLRARRVLEIGTYTGYAAIAMAMGMEEDGRVYTIEKEDELEVLQRTFFKKSGVGDRIFLHIGDACEIIPTLAEEFDLVFIDADKRQYCDYYRLVFDKVRPGGLIVADDVLWDGKVLGDSLPADAQTQGIVAFNELVRNDDRVEKLMLPVRHGMMLIGKK